ncbi:MAG: cation-transporting P-type ATPase [Dehalococcoidales bacterium]|nr:cation-transporting P-type ATPase [Dehalococcoidales bacterium]
MVDNSKWYQLSVEEVLKKLEADITGLTSSEAVDCLKQCGPNELKTKRPGVLRRFLR